MNIPTKITLARIIGVVSLLIFLFVCSVLPGFESSLIGNSGINVIYLITCVAFIIISFTDFLDGYLARKWNQVTDMGKFLDPIADKMLVDSMLIFLIFPWNFAPEQQIMMPVFCVVIMIVRDLVVDALRQIAATKKKVLAANIFGKVKTVLQMVAIPAVLLNGWPFNYFDASCGMFRISYVIVYLATIASLLSGIIYVVQNINVLKENKSE